MRYRRGIWASRTVAAIATAVLVTALSTGCTNQNTASASAMNAIATDIQKTLAARPDVTKAEVVYQNSFTASGSTDVSIVAKPGVDLHPILDESIRLVWLSKLNPLEAIGVGVADPQVPSRGITKNLVFNADEKAALQAKYGPRPK